MYLWQQQRFLALTCYKQQAAAEKAIPNCNIVFIANDEMKNALQGFYQILFEANPKSIGGALPNEDFYYTNFDNTDRRGYQYLLFYNDK